MSKLWSIRISASQYGMSVVRIKSGKTIHTVINDIYFLQVI